MEDIQRRHLPEMSNACSQFAPYDLQGDGMEEGRFQGVLAQQRQGPHEAARQRWDGLAKEGDDKSLATDAPVSAMTETAADAPGLPRSPVVRTDSAECPSGPATALAETGRGMSWGSTAVAR